MTQDRLLREIGHHRELADQGEIIRIVGLDLPADLLSKAWACLGGSVRFE